MTLFIFSVALALGISGMCSLLEATLLSYTPSQVADLEKRRPRIGRLWKVFKSDIEKPIAVILLINTAAHTIGATIAGSQFELLFGDEGVIWFSLIFTALMLQFTEILPKTMGVRHNRRVAPVIALPLFFMVRVLSPVLFLVNLINRPFEGEKSGNKAAPLEEITALAGLARISRYINPHQERVIKGATQLSDKSVSDVMIPEEQIVFLSTRQSLKEALETALVDLHTRFPICDGHDRNNVLGYVNLKELAQLVHTRPDTGDLKDIIRPVHLALPEQPANELMHVFVGRHEHMAIVKNAEGQTVGLVTVEDVVEELVGELEDEFDRLPKYLNLQSSGNWIVGGGVQLEDLVNKTGCNLPDANGKFSSWIIRHLGRQPRPNEIVKIGNASFTMRRIRRNCVFEALLSPDKKR